MRTTVLLPDELYQRARRAAAEEGRTFTSLLEQALREALDRMAGPEPRRAYRVEPFDGGGLRPGVNLDDSSALLDVMDGDARG